MTAGYAETSGVQMRRVFGLGVVGVTYVPTEPQNVSTVVFKSKLATPPSPPPVPVVDGGQHATQRVRGHQRSLIRWGGLVTPSAAYDGNTYIIRV